MSHSTPILLSFSVTHLTPHPSPKNNDRQSTQAIWRLSWNPSLSSSKFRFDVDCGYLTRPGSWHVDQLVWPFITWSCANSELTFLPTSLTFNLGLTKIQVQVNGTARVAYATLLPSDFSIRALKVALELAFYFSWFKFRFIGQNQGFGNMNVNLINHVGLICNVYNKFKGRRDLLGFL